MRPLFLFTCVVVYCCIALAPASAARYETFSPLLVDLEGWEGGSVQGMDMASSGMTMVSATREYTRDGQQVVANLTISGEGVALEPEAQPLAQEGKFETPDSLVHTTTVDKFMVTLSHSKQDNTGGVVVPLATYRGGTGGATFTLSYDGIGAEEALSLAQQFDWQAMRETAIRNQ